jgi:hypothetical protein
MKTWIKPATYGGLALLVALVLVSGLAIGGCHQVLYPLARAFGAPPESDLAVCRAAFQDLKGALAHSRVQVEPIHFAQGNTRQWRYDLAESLVREARSHTPAQFAVAPMAPDVVPTLFGRNQLRYLWERGRVYADWVKATPRGADYIWCVEIFGREGKLTAIQAYLIDAKGRLAYCTLFNSHHFGRNVPLEGDEALRLVVTRLFADLQVDPLKLFPPYGVG